MHLVAIRTAMTGGIRAELSIDAPEGCPIATASAGTEVPSYSVSKSVPPDGGETVTEEFMLDAEAALEPDGTDLEDVFSYGDKTVYRFERERGIGCPCERVEAYDCPIVDVHVREGTLFLAFHAPDMDRLSDVIANVRDRYPNVNVRRLIRSREGADEHNLVFVDRGRLTARQREVLQTAHEMGYFSHPKGANAGEVADELDITTATFTEHIAAAQSKLLDSILAS